MEEKTLFALRAPEIGKAVDETQTVTSDGGELLIKVRSRKQKIVNGKVVETTTPSCKATIGESWISSYRVVVDNQYNILDVYFNIEENTSSSERTSFITVTQDESGKKLVFHIIQKAVVTYTGYIKMVSNTLPLGNNRGDTASIIVMAYLNGSDGSKKPETPNVGSAPHWCAVAVTQFGNVENHYRLTLTALLSIQPGITRSGYIFLTCGDANLSILVTQEPPTFTLSGLPINKGYYLFGKGAKPQNTSPSDQVYIQGTSATGTTTIYIPFDANDSEPGSRVECTTGDRVSVYTKSGTWTSKGSFIVPNAGETVSI